MRPSEPAITRRVRDADAGVVDAAPEAIARSARQMCPAQRPVPAR